MPSPSSQTEASSRGLPDPMGSLRSEMAIWAEPVIADCMVDAYGERGLSGSWQQLLVIQHRRLWRALILDQKTTAARIWVEFSQDLIRAGVERDVTEEIDTVVLDELMDIVLARYRASRDKTKGFGRVLLAAAAQTASARPLHA